MEFTITRGGCFKIADYSGPLCVAVPLTLSSLRSTLPPRENERRNFAKPCCGLRCRKLLRDIHPLAGFEIDSLLLSCQYVPSPVVGFRRRFENLIAGN